MADEENDLNVGPLGPPPKERPIRIFTEQSVRALLAFSSLLLFAITLIGAFWGANAGNWENTKELLQVVIPFMTALVSGAVGFYYGSNRG